jgi:radical SAM protein with 4Fe4S-binding SPASM domain
MKLDLFKKIIDEGKEMKVNRVVPFLNGEPFTDPEYFEKLSYIREKMPDVYLEIFSNGSILTKEKVDELKKFKINFINISVNAATSESYEKVTKRKHFDKVVENTIYLIKTLKDTKIRVSMVPCPEAVSDVTKFKEFWKQYLPEDQIQINEYYNWQGRIFRSNEIQIKPCFRIAGHLTIQQDGKVIWCCMDIGDNPDYIIGDLNKQSLQEVWEKSEWRRIMHKQLKRMYLEPCKRCKS